MVGSSCEHDEWTNESICAIKEAWGKIDGSLHSHLYGGGMGIIGEGICNVYLCSLICLRIVLGESSCLLDCGSMKQDGMWEDEGLSYKGS